MHLHPTKSIVDVFNIAKDQFNSNTCELVDEFFYNALEVFVYCEENVERSQIPCFILSSKLLKNYSSHLLTNLIFLKLVLMKDSVLIEDR